jgi:hypothetical protein
MAEDVLVWLRSHGEDEAVVINSILRREMEKSVLF